MDLKRSYLEILFVPPHLLLFHRTSKSGWRENRRKLVSVFSSENSHCIVFVFLFIASIFFFLQDWEWKVSSSCERNPRKITFVLDIAQIEVGPPFPDFDTISKVKNLSELCAGGLFGQRPKERAFFLEFLPLD